MDYLDLNGGTRLDSAGNWVEPSPSGVNVIVVGGEDHARTVRYSVTTDESGTVTAAAVEETVSGRDFLVVDQDDAIIAVLALAGSRSNCLSFRPNKWVELVQGDWWDYDVTRDGLRLTRNAVLEHLTSDGFGEIVIVQGNETGSVAQRFEVEVAEE